MLLPEQSTNSGGKKKKKPVTGDPYAYPPSSSDPNQDGYSAPSVPTPPIYQPVLPDTTSIDVTPKPNKPKERKPKQHRVDNDTNFFDFMRQIKTEIEEGTYEPRRTNIPRVDRAEVTGDPRWEGIVAPRPTGDEKPELDLTIPTNRAPKGALPGVPERFKHRGNDKANPLDRLWDDQWIKEREEEFMAQGDAFNLERLYSNVIDHRFKDANDAVYQRAEQRKQRILDAISEAQNALYNTEEEGGPDYNYLEENYPNLNLDTLDFREVYGKGAVKSYWDMQENIEGIDQDADPLSSNYSSTDARSTGESPLQFQREVMHRWTKSVDEAIARFESKYNERIGDDDEASIESQGPAIPVAKDEDVRSEEDMEIIDEISEGSTFNPMDPNERDFKRMQVRQERQAIKDHLNLEQLPNVKQMLMMQVEAGQLDPEDGDAVESMIQRLKNPLHPDTRAMYAITAIRNGAKLDENATEHWINYPFEENREDYIEDEEAEAKRKAELERRENVDDWRDATGPVDAIEDAVGTALNSDLGELWSGEEFDEGLFKDYIEEGKSGQAGVSLGWTFDKLLRFNYAAAGMAMQLGKADQEPTRPWSTGDPLQVAASLGMIGPTLLLGKNPVDSLDEIVEDPGTLKDIAGEGYQQFFRGSNLPGIEEGTVPVGFADVIRSNAERDEHSNIFDNKAYQNITGFFADVAFDPTTYVGVGMVGRGGKLLLKNGLSEAAVNGVRDLQYRTAFGMYGGLMGDNAHIQRALTRKVGNKSSWVNRILHGTGNSPIVSKAQAMRLITDNPMMPFKKKLDTLVGAQRALNEQLASSTIPDAIVKFYDDSSEFVAVPGTRELRSDLLVGKADNAIDLHTIGQSIREGAPRTAKLNEDALQAESQLQWLKDSGTDAPETVAQLEARMSEGTKSVIDVNKHLDGEYDVEAATTLRNQVARTFGIKSDQVPFTDRELLAAAAEGPHLLRRVDPEFDTTYGEQFDNWYKSKNKLDNLFATKKAGGKVSQRRIDKARKSHNIALESLNVHTASAFIHYLEQLQKVGRFDFSSGQRVVENTLYRDQDVADNLLGLQDEISSRLMGSDTSQIIESTTAEPKFRNDEPNPEVENPFWDQDFTGKTLDDILEDSTGFRDEFSRLNSLQRAVGHQLKTQRISKGAHLTGVPPMTSQRLLASAPARFLKPDGTLDGAKVSVAFIVDTEAKGTKYAKDKVFYGKGAVERLKDIARNATEPAAAQRAADQAAKAEQVLGDLTGAEIAWLSNMRGYIQDRYNSLYRELNLGEKSTITGINVKTKAKNKFDPNNKPEKFAPVVLGYKNVGKKNKSTRDWIDGFIKKHVAGKQIGKWTDDVQEDWEELSSYQRNIKRVHDAITKADEADVPPVLFNFSEQPLNTTEGLKANQWMIPVLEYAHSRGVTVYHFKYKGKNHAPERELIDPDKPFPYGQGNKTPEYVDKETVVRSPRPKSHWAKMFNKEGIKNGRELREKALDTGNLQDFHDVLFSAGSPFNPTDRQFLQADDITKAHHVKGESDLTLDLGDTPNEITEVVDTKAVANFKGIALDHRPSKARSKMHKYIEEHLDEFPEVVERAADIKSPHANYIAAEELIVDKFIKTHFSKPFLEYVNDLPSKQSAKLFNDIFNGALKSQRVNKKKSAKALGEGSKNYVDTDLIGPNLLGGATYRAIVNEALDQSVREVIQQVNTRGSIATKPSNKRARFEVGRTDEELREEAKSLNEALGHPLDFDTVTSINQDYRAVGRAIRRHYNQKRAFLDIEDYRNATREEIKKVQDEINALNLQERQAMRELERSRKDAFVAKRLLNEQDRAAAILSIAEYNGKELTENQVRALVAAKEAEVDAGIEGRLAEPEIAAEATVHKWFKSLSDIVADASNYIHRPSKQVKTPEARELIAHITGGVPLIVRQDLDRINERMGQVLTENRKQAFAAVRSGQQSEKDLTGGIKQEMDEIADIFNGTNPEYQFQLEGRAKNTKSFVTWNDMAHWLPKGFMPDLKKLSAARQKNGTLTINDVWNAIPHRSPHATDPAVFAHTMRIAAAQARGVRIIKDAIGRTFGVARAANFNLVGGEYQVRSLELSPRSKQVEELRNLGWETIDELGNAHYFPPEAVKEVRTLVRIITDRDTRTDFGKMMDNAISGWKGLHTTYSPPYYIRNLLGEGLMAFMGGVNNPKYFGRSATGLKWLTGQDKDIAQLMRDLPVLEGQIKADTASGKELAFVLPKSGFKGSHEMALGLYAKHGLKSAFTNTEVRAHGFRAGASGTYSNSRVLRNAKKAFNKVHAAGEMFEDYTRYAHFLHALEHSGKSTLEEAVRYAAQRVRKYHFDYADVSTFEKIAVGRVFPFYKWTRFAAPVMLSHMFLTPGRITLPLKGMDALAGTLSSQDVMEDRNGFLPNYTNMAPSWVRDLWSYQIGGMQGAEDNYATYLRLATPQLDSLTQVFGATDSALTLMNPALKSLIEISTNQGLDSDFGNLPITGGGYNEYYNINNPEALGMYGLRQLGPFAKTAGDLWRNSQENDEGTSVGEDKSEDGYSVLKQLYSNLVGAPSVYQARGVELPQDPTTSFDPLKDTPVGTDTINEFDERGRKAADTNNSDGSGGSSELLGNLLEGVEGYGGSDDGSGWINFGNGYGGYGYGGYGGYGGSGYSFSRSPWSDSLMELIRTLRASIDQGNVID